MAKINHIISLPLVADLKLSSNDASMENVIMTLGALTVGDNKGALYYYDPLSTEPEDTANWNVVQITGRVVGRFKKVFTRTIVLPHGMLFINNGKKEFFTSGVTNANGEISINLTTNNTTNGTAIFNEILFDDSKANINAATPNDAISSYRKSLSVDKKVLVHGFVRGNASAISVLGVNVLGLRAAPQSVSCLFKIEGT